MILHEIQDWTCSRCNSIANFQILCAAAETEKKDIGNGHYKWSSTGPLIRAFATCSHCHQPCILVLRPIDGNRIKFKKDIHEHIKFLNRLSPLVDIMDRTGHHVQHPPRYVVPGDEIGEVLNWYYKVEGQFPESAIQRPEPDDLPPDINTELDQLAGVMGQPRYAMIGCRRVIERACKYKLGPSAKDMKLHSLIDAVLNDLEIAKDLSDWAHTLRNLGNDAVHDDGPAPSEEEARQAFELLKFLLDMLFISPARVKKLRG